MNPLNPDDESDVEGALLEFLNEMPIDTFLALEVSTQEQRRHMAVIHALAKNYRGNGAPYGETMRDLRRWISERANNEDSDGE
jgi:hypothetical protein